MSETVESTFLTIYKRIAPKIKNDLLTASIYSTLWDDRSEPVSSIEITTEDERFYVLLSLYANPHNEVIANYRWEYMDCITGAIIESELDYTATDEEVIAFFQHTLATDESVKKL
jgi:hypothetical protein